MYDLIDMIGRDAWLDLARCDVQDFSGQPAHPPHPFLLLLVEYCDIISTNKFLLGSRHAILRIVGVLYRGRNFSLRGQRIDGSERSGKRIRRERIVVAGFWIGFRHDFGREDLAERVTVCLLVHLFVFTLLSSQLQALQVLVHCCTYPAPLKAIL